MTSTKAKTAVVAGWGVLLAAGIFVVVGEMERKAPNRQTEVTEFLAVVNAAFATKTPAILLDRYYWEGVPDPERRLTTNLVAECFSPAFAPPGTGPKVSYTPGPTSLQRAGQWFRELWVKKRLPRRGFTRNGIKYHPNLAEVGTLSLAGRSQDPAVGFTFVLSVGEIDGKLRLVGNARSP